MHYSLRWPTAVLMSFSLFLSCMAMNSAHAKGAHAPSAETVNKDVSDEMNKQTNKDMKMTVKRILDDPRSFEGKDITVQGLYKGWSGKCPSSAMLTRSDWVLEDETGCIFVTGRMPSGVSANQPQGERIVVQGKVVLGSKGKPVIKADTLTPAP